MSISDSELHHDPFLSSIFPSMDEDDQSWLTGSMETMEDLPSPTLPSSPTASEMRTSIQCNLSRGMQHQLKHGWTSGLDLKQESDDVLDLETALRQEEAQVKWYEEQQRLRQQYRFDMQPEAPAVQPVFTAADIEQVRSQFMQRHANDSSASHTYQSASTASPRSVPTSSTSSAPSCSSSTSTFSSSTYAPLSNSTFPSFSTCTASSSRPIPPPPAPPAMPSSSSSASSSPMSNFQQQYLSQQQQQQHRHQQTQGQHTSPSYGSAYHSFHGGLSSSAPNAPATSTMQSYVPGTTPMPLHAALNAHFHPQGPEVNPRPQHSLLMHPNAYMRSIAAANSSASAPANAAGTPTNNPFSIVGPFSSDQSFLSSSVPPPPPPAPVARRRSKSSKSSSKTSSKGRGRRSTSSKSKRAQGGKSGKKDSKKDSLKSLLAQERPRNALGHFISVKELQQQLEELKNKLELSQSQYRQLQERLSCTEVELESLRTQVGSPGLDVNQHNKRMRAKRAAVVESMRASSPMSISTEPALSTSDGAVFSPEQHTHAFPL
mmetsp:Transcript_11212/g.34395  ORF Transcript_11212/g.34395 Transcript_11212/m.34395 type:complete len:545 (+) Transcript_11212:421-2055(+)|eukprot:CAMPEP_0177667636 /NCGR_PEP_ID=MMETSP0447-20121125/22235_1 /TAXON_ID=0 /ORGANISM="Stygamoeba regulata, Strain BSH-02190019" /LENGTH=544 /DNA_ID=CAMNT_0019173893 /DNA_START=190 /DNA_END=1824 /DNA_ORIENTATION=+